ncbi:hypothetical protein [Dactylosporangium sp. NPDC051541]|uniref:hypothetical protein n=1 Tax=Dactylosporangium sp. NPDC051541 TaxID=3363977 RepID=UPI0037874A2E
MELDGRYRLDRLAGTGGTAEIWHGADRLLHRPVAIRIPRRSGPDVTDQFLTDGRTAARLVHANIAAVWDVGLAELPDRGETPYVIMELADGPSLDVRLEPGHPAGPVAWRASARIGAQVAAALAHAHGQWVTHGGLTPAKILLSDIGAKVIGFTGDTEYDPAAAAADVRALGTVLATGVGGRAGDGAPATLFELVERCLSADAAARPSSDEVALVLAELSGTSVDLPAWLSEAAESRRTAVLAAIRPDIPRDGHPSLASRLFRPGRFPRFGQAAGRASGRNGSRHAAADGAARPADVEFVNLDRAAFADHATDAGGRVARLGYVDLDPATFGRHAAESRASAADSRASAADSRASAADSRASGVGSSASGASGVDGRVSGLDGRVFGAGDHAAGSGRRVHSDSSPTVHSTYADLVGADDEFRDQNPTVFAAYVPDTESQPRPSVRSAHFTEPDSVPTVRAGHVADTDSDRSVRSLRSSRSSRSWLSSRSARASGSGAGVAGSGRFASLWPARFASGAAASGAGGSGGGRLVASGAAASGAGGSGASVSGGGRLVASGASGSGASASTSASGGGRFAGWGSGGGRFAGVGGFARAGAVSGNEFVRNVRAFVRGDGTSQSRRWAFRTGAVTAGLAVVLAGAVGAVGSSVNGSKPWFGRVPQVAAVPPAIDTAPTPQDAAPLPSTAPTTAGPVPTATVAATAKNRPVTSTTHPTHTTTTAPPVIPPTESSPKPSTSPTPTATKSPTPTTSPTTSPTATLSPDPTDTDPSPPADVATDPGTQPATSGPPPGFTDVSGSTAISD